MKFKICLSGSKNVGKSSLISRFCDNVFDEKMMDTIGVAFKRKVISLRDNLKVEFAIWDFGGEEKYRSLFPNYVNGAAAALILYDTTRKETLEDIKNWADIIDKNQEDVVKILIGTKIDLKEQRQITLKEAEKVRDATKCFGPVLETSARTGENVEKAFLTAAEEIVKIKLKKCEECGDYFGGTLKFCTNCGASALKVTFS